MLHAWLVLTNCCVWLRFEADRRVAVPWSCTFYAVCSSSFVGVKCFNVEKPAFLATYFDKRLRTYLELRRNFGFGDGWDMPRKALEELQAGELTLLTIYSFYQIIDRQAAIQ